VTGRGRRTSATGTGGSPAADGTGPPCTPQTDDPEAAADERPERLAAALRLSFRDPDLLRLALTHRSVLHDVVAAGGDAAAAATRTNERLEFLGDAVLGAIAAEYLYALDPAADEGTLTRRRVALVRAETLVRWAREIDLGAYLYLGQGERPSAGARDRMLAGGFEALVGAIALDRGYAAARRFLRRFLARDAAAIVAEAEGVANPKGRLQELAQQRFRRSPAYRTAAATGPDHARLFTVEATLDGRLLGVGTGASKREAEQAAAAAALELLAAEAPPVAPNAGEPPGG
jgi:ribonuclease-3